MEIKNECGAECGDTKMEIKGGLIPICGHKCKNKKNTCKKKRIAKLEKAICLFVNKEFENMMFETDEEILTFVKSYLEKK